MTDEQPSRIARIKNHDPLARFLTETLRLSPLAFGFLIFVADVLVDGWLGWQFDAFTTSDGSTPGLLQDLTALVVDLVSVPVIAAIYLWTTVGATSLFRGLHKARIFKAEKRFVDIVDQSRPIFCNRRIFYIFLALSLLYALSQVSAYHGWVPWKTAGGYLDLNPTMSLARAPFWFLNAFTLLFAMFNVSVTVVTLRKLFRTKEIRLLPLHPDRCGGLSHISQYSVKIGYAIGSIGLVISAATVFEIRHGTMRDAYPVLLGLVAYIVAAPLFFFWPLGTAHEAMEDAKEKELLGLAREFDTIYGRVKQGVTDHKADYEEDMGRLEHLKKLYEIAQDFPVWPFDVRNLRRFFTIVTTPLIPALVSVTTEILENLISL